MIARPVVVLPQPDSPTTPSVSPRSTSRLIPRHGVDLAARCARPGTRRRGRRRAAARRSVRRWALPVPAIRHASASSGASPVADRGRRRSVRPAGTRATRPGTSRRTRGAGPRPSISGGSSSRQRSCAYGQRGANRQPGGGLTRSGGRPPMIVEPGVARLRRASGCCAAAPRCTASSCWRTARRSAPARRCCPAYITAISSVWPATTPRSWVTSSSDMLRSRRCSPSRSRICACTVTSSAVVGSSASSSVGPQARAMAIMTRWRMPPDSSCGYWLRRRAGSGMRTSCEQRLGGRPARPLATCRGAARSGSAIWRPIFITGLSDVIGSWKIIAISLPQSSRICRRRELADLAALETDLARADRAASGQQTHDRAGQDRSCPSRTHRRCRAPGPLEREGHAVDRAHDTSAASGSG